MIPADSEAGPIVHTIFVLFRGSIMAVCTFPAKLHISYLRQVGAAAYDETTHLLEIGNLGFFLFGHRIYIGIVHPS
jgi:hypothetical protein